MEEWPVAKSGKRNTACKSKKEKGVPFFPFCIDSPLSRNANTRRERGVVLDLEKGKGTRKVEHGQWPDDLLTHISPLNESEKNRPFYDPLVGFMAAGTWRTVFLSITSMPSSGQHKTANFSARGKHTFEIRLLHEQIIDPSNFVSLLRWWWSIYFHVGVYNPLVGDIRYWICIAIHKSV